MNEQIKEEILSYIRVSPLLLDDLYEYFIVLKCTIYSLLDYFQKITILYLVDILLHWQHVTLLRQSGHEPNQRFN
jgi:hypothetical protein